MFLVLKSTVSEISSYSNFLLISVIVAYLSHRVSYKRCAVFCVLFMSLSSLIENGKQTPRNHVLGMVVPIDLALRIVV